MNYLNAFAQHNLLLYQLLDEDTVHLTFVRDIWA